MKFTGIILAPLLALALLLTQAAPLSASPAQVDCGCHRAVCCCCHQPASPHSAPLPAAPARAATPDWQMTLAALEPMFSTAAPARPSVVRSCPPLPAARIPLYQRDCVFLI